MPATPDTAALARHIRSWVQPSGAIHAFKNHSVWGDNPYRAGTFYTGHTTWASPLVWALAEAQARQPDPNGQALLQRVLDFQLNATQSNGMFDFNAFATGHRQGTGLIGNVLPCTALLQALAAAPEGWRRQYGRQIDRRVRTVLGACEAQHQAGPRPHHRGAVGNQEYARLWARLCHMSLFGHEEWDELTVDALGFMVEQYHVPGLPDAESSAILRWLGDDRFTEPAEYYGLMIEPLRLGWHRYGEQWMLDEAVALARHVVHSAWTDRCGCRRMNRNYLQLDGQWHRIKEPMLIAGMGMTLASIENLAADNMDAELTEFLRATDETYATYQSTSGLLLGATGWSRESDVIACSSWASHDLCHLVRRHGVGADFWARSHQTQQGVSAVFGVNCVYLEDEHRFAIRGYDRMHESEIVGRKDAEQYKRARELTPAEAEWAMIPDEPRFYRTDDRICRFKGRSDIDALVADARVYQPVDSNDVG
jgi:hypothetical protein